MEFPIRITFVTSQDYQTRQLNTEDGHLTGPICMRHNTRTHTSNTRQPEPQLKSSSCSSVIPSQTRDVIPSHNSRNAKCLTPISRYNSMDAFRAITQGTLISRPSRYHPSLIDHTHPKQANTISDAAISFGVAHESLGLHASRPPGRGHVPAGTKHL